MAKSKEKQKSISKGTLALLIILATSAVFLALLIILRTNQGVCEFICRHFVNFYQGAAGRFYSVTNVNIFEVSVTLGVLLAIAMIVAAIALFCKKKRAQSRRVILAFAIICFGIANVYTFAAGFAYNRDAAPIETYSGEISKDVALESYILLKNDLQQCYDEIGNYNQDGSVICPYDDKQLNQKLRETVDSLLKDDYYYSYTPKAKPIISSGIMTFNSIAGITFMPTCEPGYNKDMPILERVHTLAHEYAHTKGVMREYEANLVATYVLLNSGDAFLKYCGYFYAIYFVDELIKYDETYFDNLEAYPEPEGFIQDKLISFLWWRNQPSLGDIGNFFNDLYLKVNGQQEGSDSYQETPDTEDIVIGEDDGGPVYMEIIVQYTNMHAMLVEYAQKLK